MTATTTTTAPSTRLHEVYDPTRCGVVKTGGPLSCARYVASLPPHRRAVAVIRPAGR